MAYEIEYRETNHMYHVLVNGVSVGSYPDIGAADKAANMQPVKTVICVRTSRMVEYDCYLNYEYVGSRRTRIEADQYLDKLVFERLSGLTFVRGG